MALLTGMSMTADPPSPRASLQVKSSTTIFDFHQSGTNPSKIDAAARVWDRRSAMLGLYVNSRCAYAPPSTLP